MSLSPERPPCSQEEPQEGLCALRKGSSSPRAGPKPLSAGTDAADSGPSRAHKAQLLLLIDAQLVPAAPSPGSGGDPAVSLGTRGQQEAHTAGDEHVPDAVNVEVVVSGLHESIQQDGTTRDETAWAQAEQPAAPRGWVAVPAADAAHCLGEAEKGGSGATLEPRPEPVALRCPLGPGGDPQRLPRLEFGPVSSTVMTTRSKPTLNWKAGTQVPVPKSCWDLPSPSPPSLTQAVAKIPRAKRLGPSRFQSPCRSSCRAMDSSIAPSKYST